MVNIDTVQQVLEENGYPVIGVKAVPPYATQLILLNKLIVSCYQKRIVVQGKNHDALQAMLVRKLPAEWFSNGALEKAWRYEQQHTEQQNHRNQ